MAPRRSHKTLQAVNRDLGLIWEALDRLHKDNEELRGATGSNMVADVEALLHRVEKKIDGIPGSTADPDDDPMSKLADRLDDLLQALGESQEPKQGWVASVVQRNPWAAVAAVGLGVVALAMLLGQLGQLGDVAGRLPIEQAVPVKGGK